MSHKALPDPSPAGDRGRPLSVYVLYLLAAGYLLCLVSYARPGVFYSGDAGLKFITIRQICAGEDFRYLSRTQPDWVDSIWAQGYFPIKDGFLVRGPEGHYFVFAPAFQIISAFFYRLMGHWGLYVIPFFSTLLLWAWFIHTAQKLKFSWTQIAVLFGLLAFCSPLTLYGALYWEHMLSVLLSFGAVYFFLLQPAAAWKGLALGVMSGLAIWLRPEALLLNGLLICALVYTCWRKPARAGWFFVSGILLATASFLGFNKMEYGAFFGMHGAQALDQKNYFSDLQRLKTNFHWIGFLLLKYFSIAALLAPIVFLWFKYKWPLPLQTKALIAAVIIFCISAPFLFPNEGGKQWGPRYLLLLVPIILLLLALVYREWQPLDWKWYKWPLLAFLILTIANNLVLNTFVGAFQLRSDYESRVGPALEFMRHDPGSIAVVNSENLTMEMGALYRDKHFFLTSDSTGLENLIMMFRRRGLDHFVYINADTLPPGFAGILSEHKVTLINKGSYQVAVFPLDSLP